MAAQAEAPPDAEPVTINGQTVDPQRKYALDAARTNYIIITATSVLSISQEAELQGLGAQIQENLGSDTYLCYFEPEDLSSLRELSYIRQVDVYRNRFKIQSNLDVPNQQLFTSFNAFSGPVSDLSTGSENDECLVDVIIHDLASGQTQDVADGISTRTGTPRNQLLLGENKIRLTVHRALLRAIALDDRVRIIEEVVPCVLHDDAARSDVSADLQLEPVAYRGHGQLITVADTGFDKGDTKNCHPAFRGRVAALLSVNRPGLTNDPDGHGTHVCGMVLGQHYNTEKGKLGGVAQDSQLIVQSLLAPGDRTISPPLDLKQLFHEPYHKYQSSIHSNSWGDGWNKMQAPYNNAAEQIDRFVWDNPGAFICFSAGNNGGPNYAGDSPAIGGQAAAKNCLTVGACGSSRAPAPAEKKQHVTSGEMLASSSRGPTLNGLIKPDVVAPGFNIFSAHTTDKNARWFGQKATSPEEPNAIWKPLSGTSQATPLVAGCVAVLRGLVERKGIENPPAALLRSLIITGADHLPGVLDRAQGFGRVNLKASVSILDGGILVGPNPPSRDLKLPASAGSLIGPALKQSEIFEFQLEVDDQVSLSASSQLKITLVYHDFPGSKIQNNLNLIVDTGSVNEYGNGASKETPDIQNNVEQIVVDCTEGMKLRVVVEAQNILAGLEQSFAVSWLIL